MQQAKPHFQLHFQPSSWILYEEANGQYYRKQWKEISHIGAIKRIHYNTSNWKNYLIIDIDSDDLYQWKENNLPAPNFILKNKEKVGGHLFYVLDRGIFHKNTYYLNKWNILQKEYTRVAGGDPLNKGYVGKFINSNHFEYIEIESSAYDIDFLFSKVNVNPTNNHSYTPQQGSFLYEKPTSKVKNNPRPNIDTSIIVEGERNDHIFNKTRKYAYTCVNFLTKEDFSNSIQNYVERLNQNLLKPLKMGEIRATTKSIIKYCLRNKEKIKNYNLDAKNRGVMNLDSTITKREKQKLGAAYSAKIKANKTILKLQLAILEMKEIEQKITISSLSKFTKISRPTITKYRDELAF